MIYTTIPCTCPSGDGSLRWPCPTHPNAIYAHRGLHVSSSLMHSAPVSTRRDDVTPGSPAAANAAGLTDREIMEEWDRHYLPGKANGVPFLQTVVEFARHILARPTAADAGSLTPLDYRAQGREEVLAIILSQSSEDPFTDCIGYSSPVGPDDEGGTYWNEDKLRALLHIGDRKHDAYDRAEAAYWQALGQKDEAERMTRMVERAPHWKPLHDYLAKQQSPDAWDLMRSLQVAGEADRPTAVDAGDLPDGWQLVMDEVARANRKFPTWPTDPLHAVAVLGEEFGELTKAVLQTTYEPHKVQEGDLRTEAIQTAAMALRFLASLDRYEFTQGTQHEQHIPTAEGAADQEGGA